MTIDVALHFVSQPLVRMMSENRRPCGEFTIDASKITTAPALLIVRIVLSLKLQAIGDIAELISAMIVPITIDSAVYNDLQGVVATYGSSRIWTVKAMDGAAARGRLDILQWLYDNRTEGCSRTALVYAAAEGHSDVVRWLGERYFELCTPRQALDSAVANGDLDTFKYLWSRREYLDIGFANDPITIIETSWTARGTELILMDAAGNGHTDVVQYLLPRSLLRAEVTSNALAAAVRGNHVDTVRWLVVNRYRCCSVQTLLDAAERGHVKIFAMLTAYRAQRLIISALKLATARGRTDAVRFMLQHTKIDGDLESALTCAVSQNHEEILQLLLDSKSAWDGKAIYPALRLAVKKGSAAMAKLLARVASPDDVDRMLRKAVDNDLAVAKELVKFSSPTGVVCAVTVAASCGKFDMKNLLLDNCGVVGVLETLVQCGRLNAAACLLRKCDNALTEQILQQTSQQGLSTLSKLVEDHCNPRDESCSS